MEHIDVIDRGLLEAYLLGRIPPDEEAEFEAHFFACPECAEQLDLQRGLVRGLKTLAAEELARQVAVRAGLFAWLARRGAGARWAVSLALVAALTLAAGLPLSWLARDRGALERARRESASFRSRTSELEGKLAAEERRGREARQALRDREERLTALESKPPGAGTPLVNTPIFLLSLIRGVPGEEGARIDLARAGSHFSLAVDVDDAPGVVSYRIAIRDAKGATRYRRAGLRRNALETLLVTFPSTYFEAGEYRLQVEALTADGRATEVGQYPFRIARPPL